MIEIKALRKQKGLTTTQVAKALGISQGYYSQLESGQRSFDKAQLDKLSAVIKIDSSHLHTIARRTKDNSMLSHHWLTSLPIDGVPALQAFRRADLYKKGLSSIQLRNNFKKFLLLHLPDEITKELNFNKELIDLIDASLKDKQFKA
jgi:transcriptional regulator with XRE-family HTH domain